MKKNRMIFFLVGAFMLFQGCKPEQGIPGPAGAIGSTGKSGTDGTSGPAGEKGVVGSKGPVGDKGPTGDAGKTSVSTGWKVLSGWKVAFIGKSTSGEVYLTTYETTLNEALISKKVVSDGIINTYVRTPKVNAGDTNYKIGDSSTYGTYIVFGATTKTEAYISSNSLKEGSIKLKLNISYPKKTAEEILKILEDDKLEVQMNMIIPVGN